MCCWPAQMQPFSMQVLQGRTSRTLMSLPMLVACACRLDAEGGDVLLASPDANTSALQAALGDVERQNMQLRATLGMMREVRGWTTG